MSLNDLALCAMTFPDTTPEVALEAHLAAETPELAPLPLWLSH